MNVERELLRACLLMLMLLTVPVVQDVFLLSHSPWKDLDQSRSHLRARIVGKEEVTKHQKMRHCFNGLIEGSV